MTAMNIHDPIRLTADVDRWLESSDSPMGVCRAQEWTVEYLDDEGRPFDDNVYELSVEAVHAGMIELPDGIDMWCEYVSPISVQVYVTISDPSNYNAPVTVVSPITQLARLDNTTQGTEAAMFALQVVCELASITLREVQMMSQMMVAFTSSNTEVLDALAVSGDRSVCSAVLSNPHASDDAKTMSYLKLSTTRD